MLGGAASCVIWYVVGYIEYQSFNDWLGGIWPPLFGSFISLLLVVAVSKMTPPPPPEVTDIFFGDSEDGLSSVGSPG